MKFLAGVVVGWVTLTGIARWFVKSAGIDVVAKANSRTPIPEGPLRNELRDRFQAGVDKGDISLSQTSYRARQMLSDLGVTFPSS